MTALLNVKGLRVSFPGVRGTRRVVDDVSFQIAHGEQVGVVGESGSGKSVTMMAVMGLLPPSAVVTAEAITLDDHDLRSASERDFASVRGSQIAMIFQNPMTSLDPSMRIGPQVSEPIELHDPSVSTDALKQRALELLGEAAMPNPALRATQYPYEFSGGMRQRAVIAMALAGEPRIVVADEPTTALDVTVQAQIVALLKNLAQRHGLASIVITHDLGLVAETVDRVLIMYAGRIVEETPVAELFDHPAHPYTRALLESRPVAGGRQGRLNAIPGSPPTSADAVSGCPFHPRCSFVQGRELCRLERPPLLRFTPDRASACHFVDEVLAADAATTVSAEPASATLSAGEVVLAIEGVTKHYHAVKALNGVSLDLRRGETLGIAGESGCGKSTLARIAMGLLRPTAGKVTITGREISNLSGRELRAARRHIQMVFQDPTSSLDRRMRIRAILAEPMIIARLARPEITRRVTELTRAVGLADHYLDAYPSELSGGQRQRVGIARALALNPDVVIFDEPTSALDVSIQAQIVNLLADLRRSTNAGYLFIAHDLGVLRHVSDRIAVMYLGRIVETGRTDEVFADPRHPYTRALLASAPAGHPRQRSAGKLIVSGAPPDPTDIPSGCSFRNRCPLVQEICAAERPELTIVAASGRAAACHFAQNEAPRVREFAGRDRRQTINEGGQS